MGKRWQGLAGTTWLLAFAAGCSSGAAPGAPGSAGGGPVPVTGPSTGNPVAVRYQALAPSTYVLYSRDSLAMEMPDGSFQRQLTEKSGFLTIALEPASGGLLVRVRLDSMRLAAPDVLMQSLVDSAVGTEFTGVMGEDGSLEQLEASRISVLGEQVRTTLRRLFPALPPGGVTPGSRWTDSTTVPLRLVTGMEVQEERVTAYRAGKVESRSGERWLMIESASDYRVQGQGTSYGQQLDIVGNGASRGEHRLTLAGRLTEATLADSVGMTITVPAIGQTVPTLVTGRATLRLLSDGQR